MQCCFRLFCPVSLRCRATASVKFHISCGVSQSRSFYLGSSPGSFRRTCSPRELTLPVRRYSSEEPANVPFAVIHLAEGFFQTVHHCSHLPWWAVIAFSTIILRSLVTLPFAVHQNKVIAKMELLMPTLKEYQEAVKHNVVGRCRQAGLPVEEANRRFKKEARKVARDLYAQEGCHPYKMAVLPWVQLPLWITLSLALRNMSGAFPGRAPLPEVMASLGSEGALWFSDLTLPDPYCILPVVLATTNLLNIEMHALRRKSPTTTQRVMTNTFRVLSFGMGFVASQLPAAMTLYWSMSSSYGLAQNVLFKLPRVRRRLSIPKTPSESKQPFRELAGIVGEKARVFLRRQREGHPRQK